MKNKIITLVVVGVAAVVLLGGRAVRSHLSTIRDEVKTAVRQATPDGFETKRIKALIASMSEEVLTFSDKITEVESSAAAQRKDIAQIEKRIAADRADLLTERDLLAQTNQAFHIRGAAYTRAQVQASATARLARLQRDQATLVTKRQAIERLEAAAREGQKRLQEALAIRDAKLQELELLQAQLANAKLRRDLDALAAPLENGSLARSKSELAESMKAFADRVRHVEPEASRRLEGRSFGSPERDGRKAPTSVRCLAVLHAAPGIGLELPHRCIARPFCPPTTADLAEDSAC